MTQRSVAVGVTAADLASWRDPDELLDALGRISKDDLEELSSALVSLLDHDDVDVREEAAQALFVAGKNAEHHSQVVQLLQYDPEVAVRSIAAYGVAASSTDATRSEDIRSLLQAVHQESESTEVRRSAYEALLILFRRPAFPAMNQPFDPTRDIDWKWLDGLQAAPEHRGGA